MQVVTSTSVPLDSLKWVQKPSGATESQTFYFTTHSGIYAFVQLVYSSMNSWSPFAQVTSRVYMPDGTKKVTSSSASGASLQLSSDRLSAECTPISIKYLADAATPGPSYHVTFESLPDLLIDVDVSALVEAYQINDGTHYFDSENPSSGYISTRIMPKAKVTGMIVVDGVSHDAAGHGVFSHAIQSPPQNVARWNFVNFQNDRDALILYQFQMEDGMFPQNAVSQGVLVLDNKIEAITVMNHTVFEGTTLDPFSNYMIPNAVTHVWKGTTRDTGDEIQIELHLKLDRLVDKIDVLAELPYLMRIFIQTFITAPFVYQWLETAEVTVTKGDTVSRLTGNVFHENTFLVELENTGY
ncbi:hypothetical protein BASA50_005485 [Batrachochytrium salamandrivorans]|uniref:Svf1-like C-terminal domain-containing protein n=1 Tax=Batrachochytrium salamandrivorans TaxID=1357716 RepID=A0ABQ8FFJ5_9FUNG|nr:hypothetical protein BASA60_005061 [Batrachochytrium salamandrivorans]KAH6577721.1 hypothetical protein BASA62_000702 [Batrachochytrium salamandrivorans]KAH6595905.1 hypothetical protein BASA50_005485 [Batrachochytrium salamandrivorans]KAH9249266.1 hypothetical protein BASA81_012993 [Batrachochytrium salamandrivorans]